MKHKFLLALICSSAFLGACVNVDEETSQKPFVYWKAPQDASVEHIATNQIKTNKIVSETDAKNPKKNNSEEPRFVRATEKISAGEKLGITDLIDIALENNPTTRIYWFKAKSYAAEVGKANSTYYPQVSFSADVYRSRIKPSLAYGGAFAQVGSTTKLVLVLLLK